MSNEPSPASEPPPERSGWLTWRAPVALAAVVVLLDQLTKHWAVTGLGEDRVIDVIWTLRFNLAFNRGMAFSQGAGLGPFIAIVATAVIVWLLLSLKTQSSRLATFGMGCVIGGAAGNLIDRAFRNDAWLRGGVVDFIDFQWFPIFNLADIAINIGAAVLILSTILAGRDARSERTAASMAAGSPTTIPDDPADVSDVSAKPDVSAEPDVSADPDAST